MLSYNKFMLGGNATSDAELRYTEGGTAVANFGVAFNMKFKNANGNQVEQVHYFDCVIYGPRAEKLSPMIKRGTACFVEGPLIQQTWKDTRTGQNRSKHVLRVELFNFTDPAPKNQQEAHDPY